MQRNEYNKVFYWGCVHFPPASKEPMDISEEINHQRVKHIISSYRLNPEATDVFDEYLNGLLTLYPAPIVELALVETLVQNWLTVPFQRGTTFLVQAHHRIHYWAACAIATTLTPEQFQQITGLDPNPIFAAPEVPLSPPTPDAVAPNSGVSTANECDRWFQFGLGDRVSRLTHP